MCQTNNAYTTATPLALVTLTTELSCALLNATGVGDCSAVLEVDVCATPAEPICADDVLAEPGAELTPADDVLATLGTDETKTVVVAEVGVVVPMVDVNVPERVETNADGDDDEVIEVEDKIDVAAAEELTATVAPVLEVGVLTELSTDDTDAIVALEEDVLVPIVDVDVPEAVETTAGVDDDVTAKSKDELDDDVTTAAEDELVTIGVDDATTGTEDELDAARDELVGVLKTELDVRTDDELGMGVEPDIMLAGTLVVCAVALFSVRL